MQKKRFLTPVIRALVLLFLLGGSISVRAQGDPPVSLRIAITPCATPGCDLIATFHTAPPVGETVFSADLTGRIMDAFPVTVSYPAQPSANDEQAAFFTDAALGLAGAAGEQCALALPHLESAAQRARTLDRVGHTCWLDFFRALCLREQGDYPAALLALDDMYAGLSRDEGAPWMLFRVHDAYRADTLFLNFALEAGLALDDTNLELALQEHDPADPLSDQLLAELYLLRGNHRLYFYEWDAALQDYNAALALEHAPARGYYFRGLLYYTRHDLEAARADLARYLERETDPASPLIAQTEAHLAEVNRLLNGVSPEWNDF